MKYQLITSSDIYEFNDVMNTRLEAGYVLHGPTLMQKEDHGILFAQAIIFIEEDTDPDNFDWDALESRLTVVDYYTAGSDWAVAQFENQGFVDGVDEFTRSMEKQSNKAWQFLEHRTRKNYDKARNLIKEMENKVKYIYETAIPETKGDTYAQD